MPTSPSSHFITHIPLQFFTPKSLKMFHKNKLLKRLKSMKGFWRSSKVSTVPSCRSDSSFKSEGTSEIEWEVRPGGMLVQKRRATSSEQETAMITLIVSTVSTFYHVSTEDTSTFGELKERLSMVTSLEPKEQRLLYKGKEREDNEHLHMVGVSNKDKILLLQDPAIREMKLNDMPSCAANGLRRTITVNF